MLLGHLGLLPPWPRQFLLLGLLQLAASVAVAPDLPCCVPVLATNPARRLQRRKTARREDRAIPAARLEALFADTRHGLRERLLWRMLYETAARAEEILSLDVADLDPQLRRARVTSKGGAIEYVHWATATARRWLPRVGEPF
ncbi:hypothetical protein DMB42_51805 [Nonomuraea sp. WAC 01424]|uniref:tyrosine-type recombinase/integrase n=1 Tax=Nonomuraea sp. WAC 01424 TaxID=2203200 RepID=UPI000F790F4B|nr:tyrosine-type recombinase/integrase [Nonomuraea sp. WAC 01424]RSM93952.1 hypothetical protein DMB42_51805 [Nonomuraea sp. WAC 01424]